MPSQAPSQPRTILAANVLRSRLAAGLTQRQLANLIDVDSQQVSKWERAAHRPSDENLAALSQALGRSIAWFYTDHARAAA